MCKFALLGGKLNTTTNRVVESGKGNGRLLTNESVIDEVVYAYQITQTFIIICDSSGEQEIPGLKALEGHVVLQGEMKDLLGENNYDLETEDKKLFPVVFYKGDFLNKIFHFKRAAR